MRVLWALPLAAVAIGVGTTAAIAALGDPYTPPPAPVPPAGQVAAYAQVIDPKAPIRTEIPLLALDFGVTAGTPAGAPVCQDVHFREALSSATMDFYDAAGTGRILQKIEFTERSIAGGKTGRKVVFSLTLTDPRVTTVHSVVGTTVGPYDDITLASRRCEFSSGGFTVYVDNGPAHVVR